jgi:cytoskeletal protein RodZ
MKKLAIILLVISLSLVARQTCLADSQTSSSTTSESASASASSADGSASSASSSASSASNEETSAIAAASSEESDQFVWQPNNFAANVPELNQATINNASTQPSAKNSPAGVETNQSLSGDENLKLEFLTSQTNEFASRQDEIKNQISALEAQLTKVLNYYLIGLAGLCLTFILGLVILIMLIRARRNSQSAII